MCAAVVDACCAHDIRRRQLARESTKPLVAKAHPVDAHTPPGTVSTAQRAYGTYARTIREHPRTGGAIAVTVDRFRRVPGRGVACSTGPTVVTHACRVDTAAPGRAAREAAWSVQPTAAVCTAPARVAKADAGSAGAMEAAVAGATGPHSHILSKDKQLF